MPVMDGIAAIQELRQMEARGEIRGRIPVLAVTANARQEQLETVSNTNTFLRGEDPYLLFAPKC